MIRSILIVGPEPEEAVLRHLLGLGLDVRQRSTASLDELRAAPPDVVLVDWDLGVTSGGGFCSRVKKARELTGVFVVLTAHDPEVLRAHAEESPYPADAYLSRPFSWNGLSRALEGAGGLPESSADLAVALASEDLPHEIAPAGPDFTLGAEGDLVPGGSLDEADEAGAPAETRPQTATSEPAAASDLATAADLRARLQALERPLDGSPPHRASPEERVQWLRTRNRDLEQRVGELVSWARTALEVLEVSDAARERHEEAARAAQAETERVERRFQSYEAEVHRVVRKKQSDEKAIASTLRDARARIAELEARHADDRDRLRILEDEVERLDDVGQAAESRARTAEEARDRAHEELEGLRERLRESDALLDDMQAEVVRLRRDAGQERDSARARLGDLEAKLRTWMERLSELERTLTGGLS